MKASLAKRQAAQAADQVAADVAEIKEMLTAAGPRAGAGEPSALEAKLDELARDVKAIERKLAAVAKSVAPEK